VRTCSVCGTEIDKTTAYTKTGEQKSAPQAGTKATTATESIPATNDADEEASSTMKYIIGAVVVAVVLWLVMSNYTN
jgi:uncharacterized protein (DUF983 family)